MHLFSTPLLSTRFDNLHGPTPPAGPAHASSGAALVIVQHVWTRAGAITQAGQKFAANMLAQRASQAMQWLAARLVLPALVMAVLLAVPLASTLGLLHRSAHGPLGDGAATNPLHALKVAPAGRAGTSVNMNAGYSAAITQLLPIHAADADCLLFDQLCHTGSPAQAAQPLPLVPVLFFFLDFFGADARVIWPTPFHARGPPRAR